MAKRLANAKGNATIRGITLTRCPLGLQEQGLHIFFGYKVHLIVDARSQLPLDVKVTPANEADSPQAKPLLKGAKERHPEIRIDSASMDSAYDSYENHRFAIKDIGKLPSLP